MFAPVIFLPLLAPGIAWLVAIPALAVQTLTDAYTQYDINAHYTSYAALSAAGFASGNFSRRRIRSRKVRAQSGKP